MQKCLIIVCSLLVAVWLGFFVYDNIRVYNDIGATFFTPPKTKIVKDSSSRHSDEDIDKCIKLLCGSNFGKNRFNEVYLLEARYDDEFSKKEEKNSPFERIVLLGELYYGYHNNQANSYGEGARVDGIHFSFKKDSDGNWELYAWGEG